MLDQLEKLTTWFIMLLASDVRISAAMMAVAVSIALKRWKQSVAIGLITYSIVPAILNNPFYPLDVVFGNAIAASLAVLGVKGIEAKLDQFDLKAAVKLISKYFKGPGK